jgi:hypothetical protein
MDPSFPPPTQTSFTRLSPLVLSPQTENRISKFNATPNEPLQTENSNPKHNYCHRITPRMRSLLINFAPHTLLLHAPLARKTDGWAAVNFEFIDSCWPIPWVWIDSIVEGGPHCADWKALEISWLHGRSRLLALLPFDYRLSAVSSLHFLSPPLSLSLSLSFSLSLSSFDGCLSLWMYTVSRFQVTAVHLHRA